MRQTPSHLPHERQAHRPNCERPEACVARGAGHCRSCHSRSVAKALNADPEFKAKNAALASERMKALHADPEFKAKASERMKALNADPEFKAKASERMKALHADPEFKAKNAALASERMKALNADKIKALGLREDEVSEWRAIRAKGFSGPEAARIVIRSRKDEAA